MLDDVKLEPEEIADYMNYWQEKYDSLEKKSLPVDCWIFESSIPEASSSFLNGNFPALLFGSIDGDFTMEMKRHWKKKTKNISLKNEQALIRVLGPGLGNQPARSSAAC